MAWSAHRILQFRVSVYGFQLAFKAQFDSIRRWFGGSIPAAAITLGTQSIKSDLSWRLPLIFQCFPAMIVLCVVWFLPESPRWLLAHKRDEEAKAFLIRFHGGGNPNHPIVDIEWQEFKNSIATDGADKRWYDYSELYKTRSHRWRFLMVIMMVWRARISLAFLLYLSRKGNLRSVQWQWSR